MAVLSEEDEGKFLVDSEGDTIGIVTQVDAADDVAWVEPDPGLAESVVQGLGFGDKDDDDIAVPFDAIETVSDEEIRVDRDL